MAFEFNYLKQEKKIDNADVINNKVIQATNEKREKLLVDSIMEFQRMRNSKDSEKKKFVENVESKVEQITENSRENIFNKIISERKKGNIDWKDALYEEKNKALSNIEDYEPNKLLIELDDNSLGNALKPLDKELRENIYVIRDRVDLDQLNTIILKRAESSDIVFHVSPKEIQDEIKKSKEDEYIYFSSDLKKLFNLKTAKYIYALRINRDLLNKSKYSSVDCFHKLRAGSEGFSIVDKIKIFDENNPSYRGNVLNSLGAEFYQDYLSSDDHGSEAMKRDNEDRFTL